MKDVRVRVSFAGPHVAIELADFKRVEGWYPHGHHDDSIGMEMDRELGVVKTRLYRACPETINKLLDELNKSDDTRAEYSSEEYDGYSPFNVPRRNCAGWVCVILRKAENHADLSNLPKMKLFMPVKYIYAPSTNPTKICETHGLMPYHFLPGGERVPPITSKEDFNTYRPLINELFYQTP